jgi:hypothetical protein
LVECAKEVDGDIDVCRLCFVYRFNLFALILMQISPGHVSPHSLLWHGTWLKRVPPTTDSQAHQTDSGASIDDLLSLVVQTFRSRPPDVLFADMTREHLFNEEYNDRA